MGYYNMIYQYDENKFIEKCRKTGVDGLIVVDLPFPENKIFAKNLKKKILILFNLFHPLHQKTV